MVSIFWCLNQASKTPSVAVGRKATDLPAKALHRRMERPRTETKPCCWTRRMRSSAGVFERFDGFAILALRDTVAIERHGAGERVVRALGIVDMAPAVEGLLGLGEIGEGWSLQRLGLERAVEALLLAERLRVVGPGVADGDVGLDQPDGEQREVVAAAIAPGRAVVGGDAPRAARSGQRRDQARLHGFGGLVGAGRQHDREARMVVEHGERMQPAGAQGDVALEVHLPQIVGGVVLEADEGLCAATLHPELDAVATQDAGHRRGRWTAHPRARTAPARSCARPRPGAPPAPQAPPLPSPGCCARGSSADAASAPQALLRLPPDSARSACKPTSGRSRSVGTTRSHSPPPPSPTRQIPASDSSRFCSPNGIPNPLAQNAQKLFAMSSHTCSRCPRSKQRTGRSLISLTISPIVNAA